MENKSEVFAQGGTFTCSVSNSNKCITQSSCQGTDYTALFPDGTRCEDYEGTLIPDNPKKCPSTGGAPVGFSCQKGPGVCRANEWYCSGSTVRIHCNAIGGAYDINEDCGAKQLYCAVNGTIGNGGAGAECTNNITGGITGPHPGETCNEEIRGCIDVKMLMFCDLKTRRYSTIDCSNSGKKCQPNGINSFCGDVTQTTPQTPGGGGGNANTVVDLDTLISGMTGFKFTTNNKLGDIVGQLLPYLYAIAGTALLIYMIVAGFKFLTSAGDPKKLESAKGSLTAAIIGFIIIFVAFWLTQVVNFVFKLGAGI